MIPLVRYTTIGCVRVWRTYWVVRYVAPLAAVAIPCGGYIAGRVLPAAPIPYVEPAPLLLPPDVAYAPLPSVRGYEPSHLAGSAPPRWSREVPGVGGAMPGPSAGGVIAPDVSCVDPCSIQPNTTDHLISPAVTLLPTIDVVPVEPIPVPEPPGGVLFALAVLWLLGLRAGGMLLASAFGLSCWLCLFWAL